MTSLASIHQFPQKGEKPHLAEIPNVLAPCPEGSGATVNLSVSQSTIEKLVAAKRRTDLFQAWAHLVGIMPPVNNADLVRRTEHPDATITTLADAHACFKGVKRRYDQDDDGRDIHIFIINTPYTVRWQSDMRTVAGVFPAPDNTLLTVQVRPRDTLQGCQPGIWGGISRWEFVNASRERTDFPEGFDNRYDTLLWHRQAMNEITDLDSWLHEDCGRVAVYLADADCVEYVSEDTTTVFRRVDPFLTLIYDETNAIVIGFKLKGFKRILESIRAKFNLDEHGFVELVQVFEAVCSQLGDEIFSEPDRKNAYAAAAKLARDVKLYDLPLAA